MQWEAVPNTAGTSDYTPEGGRVTFPPGVSSATIPFFILDDFEPEFTESLTLRLLDAGITGGARLGDTDSAIINVLPSDDPNGALGIKTLRVHMLHRFILFWEHLSVRNRKWEGQFLEAFYTRVRRV